MTAAGVALIVMAVAAALAIGAALAVPARSRVLSVGLLTALSAAAGGVAALTVLVGGDPVTADLPHLFPLAGVRIELDALGALFTFAASLVAVPAAVFGIGYSGHGRST